VDREPDNIDVEAEALCYGVLDRLMLADTRADSIVTMYITYINKMCKYLGRWEQILALMSLAHMCLTRLTGSTSTSPCSWATS